ncbi:hypothetical protein K491DRAFT_756313 [Lophiostoma macrostomum CBS 122681]|uniref:C3H1-type domain-containing protein n=1 Tax=Lophiostoma macrostomum CBS 122681 TaxID=1314788 RepID=A0A6A6THX2_9PLEO|nr:hypothetical protein K491DRAFT_756313 [Lophiostoma macrostomum CBS 122681]
MIDPSKPLAPPISPHSFFTDCPVQFANDSTLRTKRRRSLFEQESEIEESASSRTREDSSQTERLSPSGSGEGSSNIENPTYNAGIEEPTSSSVEEESSSSSTQGTLDPRPHKQQKVTATGTLPLQPRTHTRTAARTLTALEQRQRTHRHHKFPATGIKPIPSSTRRRSSARIVTESFARMDLQQRQKLEAMFPGGWVGECGRNAFITIPIDSIKREVLYTDVRGPTPDGHPPLGEIDMEDESVVLPYPEYQSEFNRAGERSKQPIGNAPPYFLDLPWDIMENISLEELVVYFPNHVLCWPGLALILRVAGWDMLFNRTANLINIARGSDVFEDRRYRHVEPLPCMMKMQKAIQELEPEYRIADHDRVWASMIKPEYVSQVHRRRPRALEGKSLRMITLEESGGYVQSHPFNQRPFSSKVRKALAIQDDRKITDPLVRNVFGMDPPNPRTGRAASSNPTTRHEGQRRTHDRHHSTVADFDMTDAGEFADVEDNSTEPPPTPTPASFPTRQSSCTHGPGCTRPKCTPCKNGPNCRNQRQGRCKYRHDDGSTPLTSHDQSRTTEPSTQENGSSQRVCRFGANCRNKSTCHFSHPEADALTSQSTDPPRIPNICPYGSRCMNPNCALTHPQQPSSSSSLSNQTHPSTQPPQPSSSTQNQQRSTAPSTSATRDPKNSRLCTFLPSCRRADCAFGHPTPANLSFKHVKFAQQCRYGADCTNRKCKANHPSPAAATAGVGGHGQRGGGGGGRNGQGERGEGGMGNGNGNGNKHGVGEKQRGQGGGRSGSGGSGQGGNGRRGNSSERQHGNGSHNDTGGNDNKNTNDGPGANSARRPEYEDEMM